MLIEKKALNYVSETVHIHTLHALLRQDIIAGLMLQIVLMSFNSLVNTLFKCLQYAYKVKELIS